MATETVKSYDVYVLSRPNGQPFYVGKGTGYRLHDHEREARSGHKCHKCSIIRKIWKAGNEVTRSIVFTTDDETEALAHEIEVIAQYGRKSLVNLTDGGEGMSGHSPTPETRTKIGASAAARWADPEQRARIMEGLEAYLSSVDGRSKRSEAMQRCYEDPDFRARVAAANIAIANDPVVRAKKSAAMKIRSAEPARRAQRSAAMKARYADPAAREQLEASKRTRSADPAYRSKQSAIAKAAWARRKAAQAAQDTTP